MTQRALVRQADVTRAVRGARAAGLTVTGLRIDDAGVTVLTAEAPADGSADREDIAALRQAEAYLDATYGETENPLLPGDQGARILEGDPGNARGRA